VVWKSEANDRTLSNEELADHAIEMLRAEIERAATKRLTLKAWRSVAW